MAFRVLLVVAAVLKRWGLWRQAIALLVCYEGYLRISELCSLRWKDLILPGDARLSRRSSCKGGLRVKSSKTGNNQFVVIRSAYVLTLLRQMKFVYKKDRPRDILFGVRIAVLRKNFGRALKYLGLDGNGFVVHSIRHGAATEALLDGIPLQEVLEKGRWKAASSARHYIQQGRALFIATSIPSMITEFGAHIELDVVKYFSFA